MQNHPALTILAPAKLNLGLFVLGKRPDGFHELRTVMHAIDLCDDLRIERKASGGITLEVEGVGAPGGPEDLTYRGAQTLESLFPPNTGVHLRLTKRIPVGAGLGGGSSDAAAAILGINQLLNLGLSREQMRERAARVGSDVPFFIFGGTALCSGRGEIIEPVSNTNIRYFLLIYPDLSTNTGKVYGQYNIQNKDILSENPLTNADIMVNIILNSFKNKEELSVDCLPNDLEKPACMAYPDLRLAMENAGRLLGGPVRLTGSGASFYVPCKDERTVFSLRKKTLSVFPRSYAVKSYVLG